MISKYLTRPCIHLTHLTPQPRSRHGRMQQIIRHRDVEQSVGATDFSAPLCRNITLPCLCRVAACRLCRMCVGGICSILHSPAYILHITLRCLAVIFVVCGGSYTIGTQRNLSEQQTFLFPYAVISPSRACAVWQREGCVGCVQVKLVASYTKQSIDNQ